MNEEIVVYAFTDHRGVELDFVTLDIMVAGEYAKSHRCVLHVRVYEYKYSCKLGDKRAQKLIVGDK